MKELNHSEVRVSLNRTLEISIMTILTTKMIRFVLFYGPYAYS